MDFPSLESREQQTEIAKEIARPFQTSCSMIAITFHKRMIHIVLLPHDTFKAPSMPHTILVEGVEY